MPSWTLQQPLFCARTAALLALLLFTMRGIRSPLLSCGVLPSQRFSGSWQPRRNLQDVREIGKDFSMPRAIRRAADMPMVPTELKLKLITSMISSTSTATGVLSVLRGENSSECNDITISAAIHRLALAKQTFQRHLAEDRAFLVLLRRARQMLQRSEVGVWGLGNMIWAVAAARAEIPELQLLVPLLIRELLQPQNIDEMNPQDVANVLWAVGTLWHHVPDIREALAVHEIAPKLTEKAATVCHALNFQGLAQVLLAIAFLKEDVPIAIQFVPVLMESLASKLGKEGFLEGDVMVLFARVVSALAALDYKHRPILDSLSRCIQRTPLDGKMRSLLNICCGFAKLGFRYTKLLRRLAKLTWSCATLNDWDVAALAWTLDVADAEGEYSTLRRMAHAEASRRGFSKEQIEHSRFGHLYWDEFSPRVAE